MYHIKKSLSEQKDISTLEVQMENQYQKNKSQLKDKGISSKPSKKRTRRSGNRKKGDGYMITDSILL